jgi:hypothetical protein
MDAEGDGVGVRHPGMVGEPAAGFLDQDQAIQ